MTRLLLATLALAAMLPRSSRAEEKVVRLSVQPMSVPKPALKYLLLPEVREMKPGNPVQWYLRSFQEQRLFFFSKQSVADRTRYLALPLAELPVKELRSYGGYALRQADWAARLDTPDWEILERVRSEGLGLRLPELGPLSVLAEALQVRFRGAVAGRRFDDAVRSAKTMLALARHLGQCPALAANRLGLTVASRAFDALEEMVGQPGCPNLYWALTDLPCPLVDLRRGLQGEGARVAAELGRLRGDAPITEAEVEEVVRRLSGTLGFAREQAGLPPRSLRVVLHKSAKDAEQLCAARARLAAAGAAVDLVRKFPPMQVILLDERRAYEDRRDEQVKLLGLAPWQIARLAGEGPARGGAFADLLPDVVQVRRAQGRLEQRIALLRYVEALRLYAAGHGGKLPARLSDCPAPLPDDPFTGKPFHYRPDGATAHLRGDGVHYQVTLNK